MQSQSLIKELSEKSLCLEDIPGLLTIEKVKPKLSKETTRVTKVHGSLHGQDILKLVKDIKEKKETKKLAVEKMAEEKELERQRFYKCKDQCECDEARCNAFGLKKCPSCHSILRSICSKTGCKVDGKKPVMILPAVAAKIAKPLNFGSDEKMENDEESDSDVESDPDAEDSESNSGDALPIEVDPTKAAELEMKSAWLSLSPPIAEKDIIGKRYGVVWQGKRTETLYVAKVIKRFLVDENGPVETLLMQSLKPKLGSGITLEDIPKYLPVDEFQFRLSDIIAGPLEVIPKGSTYFDVPSYGELKDHFRIVTKLNRDKICI